MKNAESLAAVNIHTHNTLANGKKTLVAFLSPKIKIKTSKVTHT